jgi:hypothetical protein
MTANTIQRINLASFLTSLATIVCGALIGVLGIWGIIPPENGLLWKALGSDGVVLVAAILVNLAIACYRQPGGE